ncbi:amino acid permease [Paenibacillus sp. MWE-103]|uniref:Amino acid permease n=1 Tax=Paenibacillus artemisiicola TaxID=1172618 RepID=A0ABS3W369_9BACL|nr:amino acid permease [Paenibacillus artemisiicola]MBO7742747.1 amino acid permease [Paenibacillus artemisiicola]
MDNHSLRRGLKSRHMTMISLGGSIGTGLFLASGGAIHDAGPGGALLAYSVIGIMVYFLVTSLGEMATYMPVSGTFSTYAAKFVDPSLGYALGWNYWYNWAITIAAELSAATLIIKFWLPDSPSFLWSALFLALMVGLNLLSVKGYGESEYWFAMIKIVTVVLFIAIGLLMIVGIWNGHAVGFRNFAAGDAPISGGFLSVLGVCMAAGFSFQGTELVGIAAGESEDPRRNVPRAIRSVFWRILLFYVLAIFVVGMLIPSAADTLSSDSVTASPFTIIFEKAGLSLAASVMNAVILSSVLSAGNSGMYASARMLWVLAKEGKAPRAFARLNARGVPVPALLATAAVGMLAFLASFFGDGQVYVWLLNASGMSGFIAWLGISVSHYRFRKAYAAQGRSLADLPYRSKWFPFGPILAGAMCMAVIVGQSIGAVSDGKVDWTFLFASYIGIPLFLAIWLGYKWKHGTRLLKPEACDLETEEG